MVTAEEIKASIKITEVAERLGIQHRNGKALCPFHQEKTPSFSLDDKKGIYKCFGCGECGDTITLYQKLTGSDFSSAIRDLGKNMEITKNKPVETANTPDPELYDQLIGFLLKEGYGEKIESYLTSRGFDQKTLTRFMIAGIKDLEKTKTFLSSFGKDRLMKAGLIGKSGFIFSHHPLIIPVVADNQIIALRGRNLTGEKPKYLQSIGIPLPLWNADEPGDTVYLTEGEFDAITLSQLGLTAYGIMGTNGFKEEFKKYFESKDVVLAFDNDESGKKATEKVAETLKETANSIACLELPEGIKDINECFTKKVDILSLPQKVLKEGLRIMHIADIAAIQRKDQSLEKKPTGFQLLDEVFQGGLRAGNMVIVAALAGEGKTAFMQTVSSHYSRQGITSLWLSYEETLSEIWDRFESMGANQSSVLFAPFSNEDNKIGFIEKAIIKQKKKTPFFVAFIDQLSNLAPMLDKDVNVNQINSNISLYLGLMSKQLKELAMKHQIIIFVAHQLGRTGELAYSDMVRHAPDKVLYIEREPAPSGSTDKFTDKTFLKVNKNRPYGTRPIIPMGIADGRFVSYGVSTAIAQAERILNTPML